VRRKRKHIPMIEIAAAFAADRLPAWEVQHLKALRAPAREVLRYFTPDHIKLHSWGGADKWWNLHMARRSIEQRAKDAADTKRAFKAYRIDDKWRAFTRAMATGKKPPPRKSTWPKRKSRRA
jgi:hypothetical protein